MQVHRTRALVALLAALALLAAACSGETSDESTDDTGGGGEPAAGPSDDPPPATGEFASSTYDDPRGELFVDFQESFDRTGDPFSSLDEFCLPHPAAEDREATDPGITADSIEVHHIRSQLENLADIGFAVPVGEPAKMFETLIGVINDDCGGIRGRTLDLGLSEYDVLSPNVEDVKIATCLEATEDRNAVVVMNSTGFQGGALLCIAEEHETAIITTQGVSDEFNERGEGRLLTLDESLTESMVGLARIADEEGLLDDRTIAVIGNDSPGQPESVAALVDELESLGHEVTVDATLGCNGQTTCTDGLEQAVSDMADAGADAVFPMLGVTTLPTLVSEMVTQGFEPGDVQFFNSKQNSQDGDLVTSKVVAFGGEAAGALYDGAFIVTSAAPSDDGVPDGLPPFDQLCVDTYAANGGTALEDMEGSEQGMLSTVCSQIRVMARAMWLAGDNPTRADIYAELADIGPFDANTMLPASWEDGDVTASDVAQTVTFTFPCEVPEFRFDELDTCVVPNLDFREAFG